MKARWNNEVINQINTTLLFTTSICNCKAVTLILAAQNVYQVFLDGNMIAFGPSRGSHMITKIDRIELGNIENSTLTVKVCYNGVDNYFTANVKPFFAAEIYSGKRLIKDTDDFKCFYYTDRIRKTQRYSFQRHFSESYEVSDEWETFLLGGCCPYRSLDLTEAETNSFVPRDTSYPTYNRRNPVMICDSGTVKTNDSAEIRSDRAIDNVGDIIGGFKREELKEVLSDTVGRLEFYSCETEGLECKEYRTYDFGRNLSGFIQLEAKVDLQSEIYIIWDEIQHEKKTDFFRIDTCNVIKYKLGKGTHKLLSFEPYTMRYMTVIVMSGKLNNYAVSLVSFENPDADRFDFCCLDKALENIVSAAKNTFVQNAVDILTDCPSRERAGWLCDTYFSAQAERLFTGDNKVERAFLENYLSLPSDTKLPDGMIPMCYPADHPNGKYIPNWSMWYVLELKSYLERTGDRDLIDRSKDIVSGLLSFFEKYENEYGLLENLDSWVFVEWSRANEFVQNVNFPSNMLYCGMLDAAAFLYDLPVLSQKSEKLRKTIRELSLSGMFFVDNAVRKNGKLIITNNMTETCQYYAFYFGVADKLTDRQLLNTLLHDFGIFRDESKLYPYVCGSNAFIGNILRLDYLSTHGYAEEAVKQCREYYEYMAQRTGTLWEYDSIDASCNHGFASYVANIIIRGLTDFDVTRNESIISCKKENIIKCSVKIPTQSETIEITCV